MTARAWLRGKLDAIGGLESHTDAAGNLWATMRGESDRALLIGGHIDSVPNGGWLDGCLNVMAGVEILRRLNEQYRGRPPVTVRLVDWADEEGARFGKSLYGSSACAGSLDLAEARGLKDKQNIPLPDALKAGDEVRTGPVGLAAMSQPDDIAEDFQIMPVSGTLIRIPAGATHLFLGLVDSFYKDNCGALTITIEGAQSFDICLQDNASGDTLLFNSFTGDWRFLRCGADGFVHNDTGGRRAIQRRGTTLTLNDAFVSAVVDLAYSRGSATIKNPNIVGGSFQIQDSYTKDNTCGCR